jgi:hypothetical protein
MALDPTKFATCCFCVQSIPFESAVVLVIYAPRDREQCQELFAHRTCLRDHVSETIPLLTELEDL